MKQKFFTLAVLFSLTIISAKTFSQTAPGDNGTGTGTGTGGTIDGGGTTGTPPPAFVCPAASFKRNNGNGTCLGYAQIRVVFPDQFSPTFQTPKIVAISYQGQPVKYALPPDGIQGVPTYTGQGYISYCLGTMSQFPGFSKELNNIPPAYKLQITFQYITGDQCTVLEND